MMNNPEIERGFIGCLLLKPVMSCFYASKANVNDEWFTDDLCLKAWKLASGMTKETINTVSIMGEARRRNVEIDMNFLSSCLDSSPTPDYIGHWIGEMRKAFLRRKIKQISALSSLNADDPDKDPDEMVAEYQMMLHNAASEIESIKPIDQIYVHIVDKWESSKDHKAVGLPSSWPALQSIIGGYRPGKVYIFGARPGAGKSTFMMNECFNLSMLGHPVSIASIEMDESELRGRILATYCDKSAFGLDTGYYHGCDFSDIREAGSEHATLPIRINDDGNMTIEKLIAWGQFEAIKHKAEFIAIDYLQIISSSGKRESRNLEVAGFMGKIRQLAKSTNVPVLLLSQLSRSQPRDKRAPDLHDLRDSGSIEQDAYAVMFIHHDKDEVDGQEIEDSEFIIAKNRGGPTGSVKVRFERNRQKFMEK